MWDLPFHAFKIKSQSVICKGIDDLGSGKAALILEDVDDHYLVFMRLDIS